MIVFAERYICEEVKVGETGAYQLFVASISISISISLLVVKFNGGVGGRPSPHRPLLLKCSSYTRVSHGLEAHMNFIPFLKS